MSALHTPGPWTVEQMRLGPHVTDRRSGLVVNGPDADPLPQRICDMRCDQQKRYDEMQANAALIAAAPDLLAACDEAYLLLADAHPGAAARIMATICKARPDAANNAS